MNKPKILLVDDEPNILHSMQRQLRSRYSVFTAESGEAALTLLQNKDSFAVIISDMRMPVMDGVQLLSRVKVSCPDTVRIMLTGNADQETATDAVNSGQIFRFLTKPCSTAALMTSLALAVRQHSLLVAEKELLGKTLKGSIAVMTELLSLANAAAFSSGYRIRPMVKQIAKELQLPGLWQYELAAMMSQIGCITLPGEILQKRQAGIELSEEEQQMYNNHPLIGGRIIRQIPRLEMVAAMIENQFCPFEYNEKQSDLIEEDVRTGAAVLHTAIEYDLLQQQGFDHSSILRKMHRQKKQYKADILTLLEKYRPEKISTTVRSVKFKDILPGMIVEEDIHAKNGVMLIPKGMKITWQIIQSLTNFKKQIGIVEPISVQEYTTEAAEDIPVFTCPSFPWRV